METLQAGDWVRTADGHEGKILLIARLSAFSEIKGHDEMRTHPFLLSELAAVKDHELDVRDVNKAWDDRREVAAVSRSILSSKPLRWAPLFGQQVEEFEAGIVRVGKVLRRCGHSNRTNAQGNGGPTDLKHNPLD
jgi:hypothetical protein